MIGSSKSTCVSSHNICRNLMSCNHFEFSPRLIVIKVVSSALKLFQTSLPTHKDAAEF